MKRLSFSLLFVVLVSAFGLGWTLDSYFEHVNENIPENSASPELIAYHQLGLNLASTLDQHTEAEAFIANWRGEQGLTLSLMEMSNVSLPKSLQNSLLSGIPLELESEQDILIHFILPQRQQVLVMSVLKPELAETNQALQLMLTSLFYGGILLVVIVWLYPLTRQLKRLREHTQALGQGMLDKRLSISSTSYISDIEGEFNNMATRIETLIQDNKLLGNAVSHDLRTPLARLRFGIEALQQTSSEKSRDKYQKHISRDIAEMERLVSVLLNYARLEQHLVSLSKTSIDLSRLVTHCVGLQEMQLPHGKSIQWQPSVAIWINGDEDYLIMMINNLLDNARQYAHKRIQITLVQNRATVSLGIADDGEGVCESQRPLVLNPFTRGQNALPNSGYGMGLAIASRIANWHDATISIGESYALKGAQFSLLFNRAHSQQ